MLAAAAVVAQLMVSRAVLGQILRLEVDEVAVVLALKMAWQILAAVAVVAAVQQFLEQVEVAG
tara:strand:- start:179 stop:367 length:189 start_codon:yes stop_codon:yes gene_type:complete